MSMTNAQRTRAERVIEQARDLERELRADTEAKITESAQRWGAREGRRERRQAGVEPTDDGGLSAMAEAGLPLTRRAPDRERADRLTLSDLREAGVPLKDGAGESAEFNNLTVPEQLVVLEQVGEERANRMREATGIPFRGGVNGLRLDEAAITERMGLDKDPATGIQALREAGIPVREASSASTAHALLSKLDKVVPRGHADRATLDRLRSKDLLDEDNRHEIDGIAAKHADALAADDDTDPLREAARGAGNGEITLEQAAAEFGIPLRA